MDEPKPNLFIVGAPKCGTTALYQYLDGHEDIYMSTVKEPHFFGSDLENRYGIQDYEEYMKLFSDATGQKWIGEGSVYYLLSTQAAKEIYKFNPEARIIITLRNPIDAMYSLHSQRLYSGNEDVVDFERALEYEVERANGMRIPKECNIVQALQYRSVFKYTDQLIRFQEMFGMEKIKIVLFDDIRCRPLNIYKEILSFLILDYDGRENFNVINSNKTSYINSISKLLRKPPMWLKSLARPILGQGLNEGIISSLLRLNTRSEQRTPMSSALRVKLQEEFGPEISRLEIFLNRDLSTWYCPPGRENASTIIKNII